MIRKSLQINENGKLLQHKYSVLRQICRMMVTDALQGLKPISKSRNLTKAVISEAKR
ncbi:hypothetical protein NDI47_24385 [Microcoleus vaginatus GB1-A2]|uniref:hypothetical protein n=1 Tax=Microcoleus vaginatus TaxID=119532 RepID=UPI0016881A8F|nr:hypothetical protein [Microcoleus sp. FACHB-61]